MCVLKQSIAPYVDSPFHFVETGINVYSFEELLFHCYHYWKESVNDLIDGNISEWVKEKLDLTFIAAQIDKIVASEDRLSEKYLKFLAIENYFDDDDLYMLEFKIMTWENKSELEKLKQQGDERLEAEDYEKALFYYNKLVTFGDSAPIFNNIGCCYLKLGQLSDAENALDCACELDKRNPKIKLNQAMLYSLQNRSMKAEKLLLELEKTDNDRYVQYYLGDLELRQNHLEKAFKHFMLSADMGNTLDANAALCKIALKKEQYNEAKQFLSRIPDKTSRQYLYNMAQINYTLGDKHAALKNLEQLLIKNFDKVEYWAFVAKLYRETGNLERAINAIEKALDIDQTNEEAIFESASIKKAQGNTMEYQSLLRQIVEKWKTKYKMSS